MKYLAVITGCLFFCFFVRISSIFSSAGQKLEELNYGSITFSTLDSQTLIPVGFAKVTAYPSSVSLTTSGDGKFTISGAPSSRHNVKVSKTGYKDEMFELVIEKNDLRGVIYLVKKNNKPGLPAADINEFNDVIRNDGNQKLSDAKKGKSKTGVSGTPDMDIYSITIEDIQSNKDEKIIKKQSAESRLFADLKKDIEKIVTPAISNVEDEEQQDIQTNIAQVQYDSELNSIVLGQEGDFNRANLTIDGFDNSYTLEQKGLNNLLELSCSGEKNSGSFIQSGTGNLLNLFQSGSNNQVYILQSNAN